MSIERFKQAYGGDSNIPGNLKKQVICYVMDYSKLSDTQMDEQLRILGIRSTDIFNSQIGVKEIKDLKQLALELNEAMYEIKRRYGTTDKMMDIILRGGYTPN